MNILLAPNSFKECADSVTITKVLSNQFSDRKSYNLIAKPLSDGGDGFLSVCELLFHLNLLTYYIKNSYDGWLNEYKLFYNDLEKEIYIETAELFGMKSFPRNELNPLNFNSEILGKILLRLKEEVETGKLEVKNVIIGLGGTATIDFGIGACSQLGLTLYDVKGNLLEPIPENFIKVRSFIFSKITLPFKINFIVDVETPLLGEPGAIEIYGKQKGANDEVLSIIKSGVQNLLKLFAENGRLNIPLKLNGAGGGIGSGISLFYDAKIIPANRFIEKYILNDINPQKIDAVITGEGKFDFQSFEGKGIGVLLKMFQNVDIPIFIICGEADLPDRINLPSKLKIIELQKLFKDKDESIKNINSGLAKASDLIKNQLKH